MQLSTEPRQTTSNLGHLQKPSIQVRSIDSGTSVLFSFFFRAFADICCLPCLQALIHGLGKYYYSLPINYRKNELEQKARVHAMYKRDILRTSVARMSLTGVGCRLQTCRWLAPQRFDSAFRAFFLFLQLYFFFISLPFSYQYNPQRLFPSTVDAAEPSQEELDGWIASDRLSRPLQAECDSYQGAVKWEGKLPFAEIFKCCLLFVQEMVDLTKAYHKALDEEEGMTKEQLAIKNVGKQVRKCWRIPLPLQTVIWAGSQQIDIVVCVCVCMRACAHVVMCFLIIHHISNNSEACWAVCWVWVPAFLHSRSASSRRQCLPALG